MKSIIKLSRFLLIALCLGTMNIKAKPTACGNIQCEEGACREICDQRGATFASDVCSSFCDQEAAKIKAVENAQRDELIAQKAAESAARSKAMFDQMRELLKLQQR